MRRLYGVLACLIAPFAFLSVLWRAVRDSAYRVGLSERFGFGAVAHAPAIWVHAVSLGEVTAAAPLVRALRARDPACRLLLTTATPTGRARAAALFGSGVEVRFLPYDTPGAVARFLRRQRPRLGIILETELWPTLYAGCRRRGIPLILASARLSASSVRRYARLGSLPREVLAAVTWLAAQSAEDAARFISLGADRARTVVVGNLKFDVDLDAGTADAGRVLRERCWAGRPVWIAGSTHTGEESVLLAAHAALRTTVPGALLLLVPRHPARFESVADLLTHDGVRFERRSSLLRGAALDGAAPDSSGFDGAGTAVDPNTSVLLVDTVGELAALYAAADLAFVGGSLVPVGGHNLLEPAALGSPVLTGPHLANARDISRRLLDAGAAAVVADADQLEHCLRGLFADPSRRARMGDAGRRVIETHRGSVARLLALIGPLLAPLPPAVTPPGGSPADAACP